MARLARLPAAAAWGWGIIGLILVVLVDGAGRSAGLRLAPLYVPLLCATFWTLGRWRAIGFALLATPVALTPDILLSSTPFGMATLVNAFVRAATYIFLALIIAAYRRAYDEADYRAMYDGLTGALNKMPFEAAVVRHVAAARRGRQTLLAACVDLDGFKEINGSYGRAAGDAALRAISEEAMRAVRGSDLLGRLGGDEFGFLLSASSAQNAEALAHLLHQRVSTTLAKTGLPLSCSMGALIVGPGAARSEAEMFDHADRLMRQARGSGRGRVLTELAN
jgi:diguanylate cyclase (GGDEF)-like protein